MIILAVALLLGAIAALIAGVLLGEGGLALVWAAAVAAPLSLVVMWLGLRRMLPRRARRSSE